MKKLFYSAIAMILMAVVASCSRSGKDQFLNVVPDDVDFVALIDINAMMKSAGGSINGSEVKLPQALLEMCDYDERAEIEKNLQEIKDSGVDCNSVAIFGKYDSEPIFVFKYVDKSTLIVGDGDYREIGSESGYKFFESTEQNDDKWIVAVKDGYAFWIEDHPYRPGYAKSELKNYLGSLAMKKFDKSKIANFITAGNTFGAMLRMPEELAKEMAFAGVPESMQAIFSGYVGFTGNLSDDKAVVDMRYFDRDGRVIDGKAFKEYADYSAKISKQALSYLADDESLVFALAMKNVNWDKMMEQYRNSMNPTQRATMAVLKEYLSKIDGTVAYGIGVTDGLRSFLSLNRDSELLHNLTFTVVLETPKGEAQSLVNDFKSFTDSFGAELQEVVNGYSLETTEYGGRLYLIADGDFLIFANHEVTNRNKNLTVDKCDFDDNFVMAVALDRNTQLMQDLGFTFETEAVITMDALDLELRGYVELEEIKAAGFLAKVIEIIRDVNNRQSEISSKVASYNVSSGYSYYDWDDDSIENLDDYAYDDDVVYEYLVVPDSIVAE